MANIITTDTAIRFKGSSVSKTSLQKVVDLNYGEAGVRVSGPSISIEILLTDTINGQSFSTVKELRDYVDENFFKGTSGPGPEPSLTFENGLIEDEGAVKLGSKIGDKSSPISLPFSLINKKQWAAGEINTRFEVFDGESYPTIGIISDVEIEGFGLFYAQIVASLRGIFLGVADLTTGQGEFGITMSGGGNGFNRGMIVIDSSAKKGWAYADDYSEEGIKDDRWIPDYKAVKDYVDENSSDVASPDSEGKVAKYTNTGAINTAEPQFPENAVPLSFLNERISASQRAAINALVSPTSDYADMTEATAAIKSIIDALKAT